MAAFVSLVNSRRRSHGKPNMGWINPFLYTYYASFINDINTGDNQCSALYEDCGYYNCYYYNTCCSTGFYATSGWDPVTGLGSVNFDAFLATAMSATSAPTPTSSQAPTSNPTTISPSQLPTSSSPSFPPTENPTCQPSTLTPSQLPTSSSPSVPPTENPTCQPSTSTPSQVPTTSSPSSSPTWEPSFQPSTSLPTQLPTNSPVALSSGLTATTVNVIIALLTFFFGVAVGIFYMWIAKRSTYSLAHKSLEVEMSSLPVESNGQEMSINNEGAAV